MNDTTTGDQNAKPSHQQILAEHLYQLHEGVTKIAMQTWRSLRLDEASPSQIEQAKQILIEMERRIQYAKNCCYWIQDAQENQAQPAKNDNLSPLKN